MSTVRLPQILPYHMYTIVVYIGFFALKTPLPSIIVLLILYSMQYMYFRFVYVLLFFMLGFAIAYSVFLPSTDIPKWYISGKTYVVDAKIDSITYKTNQRTQIILTDILPKQRVEIQAISKKKPCTPLENGIILYKKARSCAIAYPIHTDEILFQKAVWTLSEKEFKGLVGQSIKGVFSLNSVKGVRNKDGFRIEDYWKEQGIYYRVTAKMPLDTYVLSGAGTIISRFQAYMRCAVKEMLGISKNEATTSNGIPSFGTSLQSSFWNVVVEDVTSRTPLLQRQSEVMSRILQQKEVPLVASKTHLVEGTLESSPLQRQSEAILYALLLGDRYYFTSALERIIADAGILHSLVLSGLHLSCLLLFVYPLLWGILYIAPKILLYIPKQNIQYILLFSLAMVYATLSGFPVSFVRATTMVFVLIVASCMKIRYTLLDIIFYTVFMLFCMHPQVLYTLSFQLSVGAVIGIYYTLPYIQYCTDAIRRFSLPVYLEYICISIASIFILSLAIQIVLLPISLSAFGTTSYFFIINIIWLPIVSIIVVPFLLLAYMLSLAGLHIQLLWECVQYPVILLLKMLYALQERNILYSPVLMRPHILTSIALYCALYAFVLVFTKKERSYRIYVLCAISCILLFIPIGMRIYRYYDSTLRITMFDVGKGQSILVEASGNRTLIDAGERSPSFDVGEKILSPLLTHNSFPELQALVLSHQDNDHIGGAIYLGKKYTIENMYYNGDRELRTGTIQGMLSILDTKNSLQVQEGDSIPIANDTYMKVLLPRKSIDEKSSSNAKSIVLMLVHKGKNIAFIPGDIDIAGQEYLVERYGKLLQCEILILPHHGSRHNMYIPLYTATQAKIVLVSTHKIDNNFLSKDVKKALLDAGMDIRSTYAEGGIQYSYK